MVVLDGFETTCGLLCQVISFQKGPGRKTETNPTEISQSGRCMMIIIEQTREFFGEQYVGIREIVSWS